MATWPASSCSAAPNAPEEAAEGHVAVGLGREAEPGRDPALLADLARALADELPGVRPGPGLSPEIAPVVERRGGPALRQGEVLLGPGAERALLDEGREAPEPALALGHDVGQGRHVRLVPDRRLGEREEVVPLLRRDLGVGAHAELAQREMVDLDGDAVPLAPLAGELPVEPVVVGGNEVRPLGDAEDRRRRRGSPREARRAGRRPRSRSPRRPGRHACWNPGNAARSMSSRRTLGYLALGPLPCQGIVAGLTQRKRGC